MKKLIVLFEHPQWQVPLFDALKKRGIPFEAWDLKKGFRRDTDGLGDALIFNQASPSAYLRGHTQAVPWALSLLEILEADGMEVINGSKAFRFELNKALQSRVLEKASIDHPKSVFFNHPDALLDLDLGLAFPAILKPNQGGSGARMFKVESVEEVREILSDADIWAPDYVMLLQEYLPHDHVVRMEFLGGKLLYAMKIFSEGDVFNLCPSVSCNPEEGAGSCALDYNQPPRFEPFGDVPEVAVKVGEEICALGHLDIAGIEYLESADGRRVYYDINANSNLRLAIGEHFGFDPFERVVDYLVSRL